MVLSKLFITKLPRVNEYGWMMSSHKKHKQMYPQQLTKDWSNCGAGFEGWNASKHSPDLRTRKSEKISDDGSEPEEGEQEVEIDWSSSSEEDFPRCSQIQVNRSSENRSNASRSDQVGITVGGVKQLQKGKREAVISRRQNKLVEDDEEDFRECIPVVADSGSDVSHGNNPLPTSNMNSISEMVGRSIEKNNIVHVQPRIEGKGVCPTGMPSTSRDGGKRWLRDNFVRKGKRKCIPESPKSTFEPEILDYDSPDEGSPAVPPSVGSFSISSLSTPSSDPSLTSPSPNPRGSPRTGSEWIKSLKLQVSPTAESATREGAMTAGMSATAAGNPIDSAKKKKKFVKSGFAERLQKLVSRQKSSVAMWHHNRTDSQVSQESSKSALKVKVMSYEIQHGLYVTHCLSQVTEGSKVKLHEGGEGGSSKEGEEVYVFYTKSTGDQLGLTAGLLISIHAPWQKLSIPGINNPVVLCTHFCYPVTSDLDDALKIPNSARPTGDVCSAQPFVHSPKIFGPVKLFPAAGSSVPLNEGSQDSKVPRRMGSSRPAPASIMDSVGQTGGCSSIGISFKATVQRITQRGQQRGVQHQSARKTSFLGNPPSERNSPSIIRSLLLQDRVGVCCELQLSNHVAETPIWQQVLQSGEGSSFIFKRLMLRQKVALTRSPGLFSLIGDFQAGIKQSAAQTICYILSSEVGVTSVEPIDRSDAGDDAPPYRPAVIRELRDVIKAADHTPKRQSFTAASIYSCPTTQPPITPLNTTSLPAPNESDWLLFLSAPRLRIQAHPRPLREQSTNQSNEREETDCVCLHMQQSNVLACEIMNDLQRQQKIELLCKDVLVSVGLYGLSLTADGFSNITLKADVETNSHDSPTPTLPNLSDFSRVQTLVRVTGNICGIEEDSAFSWPACPECGNNLLEGGEGSGCALHCSVCNEDVLCPLTRMHLVVMLSCSGLAQKHTVKVQLLQMTISSLLSSSSSPSNGGCDIQSIMGVLLGPMSCLVRAVTKTADRKVLKLEEIPLPDRPIKH